MNVNNVVNLLKMISTESWDGIPKHDEEISFENRISEMNLKREIRDITDDLERMLVGPLPELDDKEKELSWNGEKIEAIKHYRVRTGLMLKQSKMAIDDHVAKLKRKAMEP